MSADVLCRSRRLHKKPAAMEEVGAADYGAVVVTFFECPACGNVRKVEQQRFDQLSLFGDPR